MDDPAVAIPTVEDGAKEESGLRLGKVAVELSQARGAECGGLRFEGMNCLCATSEPG